MTDPLFLQVLWRAVLSQHGDPGVPESMKPGLRDSQPLEKRMEHTFKDVVAGDWRAVTGLEHPARPFVPEMLP